MKSIRLTERLQTVAAMVPPCRTIADIGCDHGYLSMALLQSGRAERAIATDINEGPLLAALRGAKEQGLEERMELRLADGLRGLKPGEADVAVIAGMGGHLIREMLYAAEPAVLSAIAVLIVQPQTEVGELRRALHEKGFRIGDEAMVTDRGKDYVIIRALPGAERYDSPLEYAYGRILPARRDPVLYKRLTKREEQIRDWLARVSDPDKREELLKEEQSIRGFLSVWRIENPRDA